MYKDILVALDGSNASKGALKGCGANSAGEREAARLFVISAR